MIKQDIIHQVIERTGLQRNKAEAAVDTVFETLKRAEEVGKGRGRGTSLQQRGGCMFLGTPGREALPAILYWN